MKNTRLIIATALALLLGLTLTGCQTLGPVSPEKNISYETAMTHVDSCDKGGRWLSLGIKEINEIDGLSEDDKILINHHLFSLIKDEDLRFDEDLHKQFIGELKSAGVAEEAVAAVERAHIRVSSPVVLHDGYWVTEVKTEGSPSKITIINDMHVDAATGRVTVYAQSWMLGKVVAPAQVNPGEFTTMPNGTKAGFHPNAVYLNASGQELSESDGTGAWWVKHSWVLGGEGYYNWELKPLEDYGEGLWVEGNLLEDGLTMKIGDPDGAFGYNLRMPIFEGNSVTYRVSRFEVKSEGQAAEEAFVMNWELKIKKSVFDGLARCAPKLRP